MPDCTVSAPGKPLNRLSTVRFSCRMMTMCWIFAEAGLGGFPELSPELVELEPPHPTRKAHPRSAAPKAVRTMMPPLKKIERPPRDRRELVLCGLLSPLHRRRHLPSPQNRSGGSDSDVPPAQMSLKPARGQA